MYCTFLRPIPSFLLTQNLVPEGNSQNDITTLEAKSEWILTFPLLKFRVLYTYIPVTIQAITYKPVEGCLKCIGLGCGIGWLMTICAQ